MHFRKTKRFLLSFAVHLHKCLRKAGRQPLESYLKQEKNQNYYKGI